MMPDVNGEVIIELKDLCKSYGEVNAVKNLSLQVQKGEIFGFLGPNGAGKTTTISMVCGLLKQDAGAINIDGISLEKRERSSKKWLGFCPQEIVIWDSLTCLEQLEFVARMYDVPKPLARSRSLELLVIFGLLEKKGKLAKTLSGGMKRRLNIALALAHDPQVLILDEPQAGLDPQSRVLVRDYIRSLAREKTVILTTHDMDEADRLAERIGIIDQGQLLVLDTPENLKKQVGEGDILEIMISECPEDRITRLKQALPEKLHYLDAQNGVLRFVGFDIAGILSDLLEKCRQAGLTIEDITIRKKTLEDVFISLTGRRLRQ
jgi:ABC-2 type transport system ATP-binding protein